MKTLFRILGTAAAVAVTGAAIVALDKILNQKDPLHVEEVEFPEDAELDPKEAEKAAEAYCISAGVFRRLMQQNVHVRCYAYQMTAERFSDSMWTMQQVLFMSADRRLAIFLTDELAKTGGDEVRMTHDQMAKYMGSAREVVSRMLKYFAQEGWVRLFRGGVQVLDRKKLQQLARGE